MKLEKSGGWGESIHRTCHGQVGLQITVSAPEIDLRCGRFAATHSRFCADKSQLQVGSGGHLLLGLLAALAVNFVWGHYNETIDALAGRPNPGLLAWKLRQQCALLMDDRRANCRRPGQVQGRRAASTRGAHDVVVGRRSLDDRFLCCRCNSAEEVLLLPIYVLLSIPRHGSRRHAVVSPDRGVGPSAPAEEPVYS